jgi:outer membrane protein
VRQNQLKMKTRASIFTKITLGILIGGTIVACNQPKTDSKPATTPPSADKETIVFVNQDTLAAKYDYAKDVTKKMQDKGKAAQNDVGSRQQSFQREVADYQKNANTLPADQRQTTEQRLAREERDLQSYTQNATAQFQNDQVSETNKVFEKISDLIKSYAKEKGYKLVLTYSKTNPVVIYGDKSLDVTADVLDRLNDAYKKEKK